MRYKLLGRSGVRVSELCLGTMTFGEEWGWGASREESRKIFDVFVEAGGNFLDTANKYTEGTSERLVGEFMGRERERFVVATKYTASMRESDPNAGGNQRKCLVQSLEASLRRLGTDYIDLYWVHAWDFLTPVEEVVRALDDQVRAGKVLYVGISDAPAWLAARANTLAELRGWSPFIALQIEYSLVERTSERELLPMARTLGLGVTAWSPLASGLLTGKYARGHAHEMDGGERRLDAAPFVELSERNLVVAEAVQALAREIGRTPPQVALAWVRSRPEVIPILGARKLSQLQDNLGCVDVALTEDHLRRLDEASRIELGFPHDFLTRESVRNVMYGGSLAAIDMDGRERALAGGAS